jgi:hypothetical protein
LSLQGICKRSARSCPLPHYLHQTNGYEIAVRRQPNERCDWRAGLDSSKQKRLDSFPKAGQHSVPPMKRLSSLLLILVLVMAATSAWFYYLPYLTIRHIRSAIEREDADALSAEIDFTSLRSNLREQLNFLMTNQAVTQAKDNPFSALGALFGATMIDRLLDAYVSPYGIKQLFTQSASSHASGSTSPFQIDKGRVESTFGSANCAYENASRFLVTLQNPDGSRPKLVLTRTGLSWKITNILLPTDALQKGAAAVQTGAAAAQPSPTAKVNSAQLNVPFVIGGVEIQISNLRIGRLQRVERRFSFGSVPDKSFLLANVTMRNISEGTIVHLQNVWEHASVTDNFGNVYSAPSSLALDRSEAQGLISSQPLKPGEAASDMIVIDAPLENARTFTLTCAPSLYRPTGEEHLQRISSDSFKLEFTSEDISR